MSAFGGGIPRSLSVVASGGTPGLQWTPQVCVKFGFPFSGVPRRGAFATFIVDGGKSGDSRVLSRVLWIGPRPPGILVNTQNAQVPFHVILVLNSVSGLLLSLVLFKDLFVSVPRGTAHVANWFSLLQSPPSESFDARNVERRALVVEGGQPTRGALV